MLTSSVLTFSKFSKVAYIPVASASSVVGLPTIVFTIVATSSSLMVSKLLRASVTMVVTSSVLKLFKPSKVAYIPVASESSVDGFPTTSVIVVWICSLVSPAASKSAIAWSIYPYNPVAASSPLATAPIAAVRSSITLSTILSSVSSKFSSSVLVPRSLLPVLSPKFSSSVLVPRSLLPVLSPKFSSSVLVPRSLLPVLSSALSLDARVLFIYSVIAVSWSASENAPT